MINFLRGTLLEATLEATTLDVQGVGYELHCPLNVLADLPEKLGQRLEFWISTQVREDAIQLFAFTDREQKKLFLTLLKVNGVGPKMALNILSGTSKEELVRLIETEDVKGLAKLPKVGKKTAEQMILTLKGKLVMAEEGRSVSPAQKPTDDISSALLHLGFRPPEVEKVLARLPPGLTFEEGVRESLSLLSTGL
ncbi:MAG: Holliday junction branch migration protein RuvA [Bdellovibrio sp.]|nr:MAG: Holliday junction branch migration protein RuvA [Bdellovibrio sp.]